MEKVKMAFWIWTGAVTGVKTPETNADWRACLTNVFRHSARAKYTRACMTELNSYRMFVRYNKVETAST